MRMTTEGLALLKQLEGCRLAAYYDGGTDENGVPRGKLTIGYGHTRGVFPGDQCTQEAAEAWLLDDVAEKEAAILTLLPATPLNDNQLSALVIFVYNVGFGAKGRKDGFLELKSGEPSTMLRLLRTRLYEAASLEFPKWDHIDGAKSAGILKRRLLEQALFNKEPNPWKRSIKALNPLNFLKLK